MIRHGGIQPKIHETAYIAPNAIVSGEVSIGANTAILFGAVITADSGPVTIGNNCIVMENSVIRGTSKHPVEIEDYVLVGPHSHLTGCHVKKHAFIATGSTVFNNATVGEGAEVRVNGTVHVNTNLPDNSVVPIGWVAVGNPCVVLSPGEHEKIWKIQRELNFSKTVWGLQRPLEGKSNMEQVTTRYAHSLISHKEDLIIPASSEKRRVKEQPSSKPPDKVDYTISEHTAHIVMQRPEKLNALNEDLWTGLLWAFLKAESDQDVRIVVLRGSGRSFSAGDDIEMMRSWKGDDVARWMEEQAEPLLSAILSLKKPIVSVVDGLAAGGGCELLMLSDIVVATDTSIFSIPEGLIGAIPPIGSSFGVGYINKSLLRYALTGETFSATEAKALGIVDMVVDSASLDSTVDDLIEKMERVAPISQRKIKEAANLAKRKYLEELNFGKSQLVDVASTEDFREGQNAFLQKRAPVWKNN